MKKKLVGIKIPIVEQKYWLTMKLCLILTLGFCLQVTAGIHSQSMKVTLKAKNVELEEIINQIKTQTGINFLYSVTNIADKKVSLDLVEVDLDTVLNELFEETGLTFEKQRGVVIIHLAEEEIIEAVVQEPVEIKGAVTDEEGKPLPSATIMIKGTNTGVTTDLEGKYTITVPGSEAVLVFSYVGFASKEISVGNKLIINVTLVQTASQLEDVVIVGYGEQNKVELTGTIATVKSKEIENLPVANVTQKLQGLASGVFVSNFSGAPGGATEIIIRGQSSITAGNTPLYVIDGAPVSVGSLGTIGGYRSGVRVGFSAGEYSTDVLSTLNPNDIESIEVLKDASAKAIYGARASNGVILITTKKGKFGEKTTINLSVTSGIVSPTKNYDLLNAEEYLLLQKEAYTNDNLPIPDFIQNADPNIDTDWIGLITRDNPYFSEYNLSISGATKKLSYFVSGSFRDEKGILKNSDLKRATLRANMDIQATEKLKVGLNFSIGRLNNSELTYGNVAVGNILFYALEMPPTFPERDENGIPSSPDRNYNNPLALVEEAFTESITDKFILNGYLTYKILPQLTFNTNLSIDANKIRENKIATPNSDYLIRNSIQDILKTVYNREIITYNIEPFLNYQFSLDNHNFDITLGTTFLEQSDNHSFVSGTDFPNKNLTEIGSAGTIVRVIGSSTYSGGSETAYSFNSVFSRLTYNYEQKYLLNVVLRRDGSSRFGPDSRYGTFWAISGGWNFHKESFFKNSKLLSFGKLRGSVGVTGNDQIGNFPYIGFWTSGSNYIGEAVLTSSQLENSDLKWEETMEFDIGLDLGFFNNRLELGLTYFNSSTTNLLFSQPLPYSTGFFSVTENIGKVVNKGLEINVSSSNISTKNFSWKTKLNITFSKNKVVSLLGETPIGGGNFRRIEGEPIDVFYGLDFLRVNPETGHAEYRDVNNDGEITLAGDRTVLGSGQPDFYGGLTNTLTYGNFSLDFFFQFVYGSEIANELEYFSEGLYFRTGSNAFRSILDRWQQPGDITDSPRLSIQGFHDLNQRFSDRFVEDGSYLRLKNLTLSYNIPDSVLDKLGIRSAKIFISGQNLLTLTNYSGLDPGVRIQGRQTYDYPQTAIYSLGVNINF